MLDGTLFVVKCARYGNPGKNAYQDFFLRSSCIITREFITLFTEKLIYCLTF